MFIIIVFPINYFKNLFQKTIKDEKNLSAEKKLPSTSKYNLTEIQEKPLHFYSTSEIKKIKSEPEIQIELPERNIFPFNTLKSHNNIKSIVISHDYEENEKKDIKPSVEYSIDENDNQFKKQYILNKTDNNVDDNDYLKSKVDQELLNPNISTRQGKLSSVSIYKIFLNNMFLLELRFFLNCKTFV